MKAQHTVRIAEAEIKSLTINKLGDLGLLQNATLINEFSIAGWKRRADITIANGHLMAVEIKSEHDSLKRLDGQTATYLQYFDKVIIVAATKFIPKILSICPKNVAVWELKINNTINIIRKGRIKKIVDRNTLCSILHKHELLSLLKKEKIKVEKDDQRHNLNELIHKVSIRNIRNHVITSLKKRYSKKNNPTEQPTMKQQDKQQYEDKNTLKKIKSHLLEQTYGEINNQKPLYVRKRTRKED